MKSKAADNAPAKSKPRKTPRWPKIYTRVHRSGQPGYVVDLGLINGKRERHTFKTKVEAETFAELARVKKQNEGTAAFGMSESLRLDATRASALLAPHRVNLVEAAQYFLDWH